MIPTEDAELADPYIYDDVVRVTSNSGNIGRFHWHNGYSLVIETGHSWPSFPWSPGYERSEVIYPGSCAFIATIGDFLAWIFGD